MDRVFRALRGGKMKKAKMIGTAVLAAVFMGGCSHPRLTVFTEVSLKEKAVKRQYVSRGAMEYILWQIWDSGFLNAGPVIRQEIFNNDYGVFVKPQRKGAHIRGRAYFLARGEAPDRIMLNRTLFAHFVYDHKNGPVCYLMDKRAVATMLHELFHDFWHNILDDRSRAIFTAEAETFFIELIMAEAYNDRRGFLSGLGWDNPPQEAFEVFLELIALRDEYPAKKFFGTEMYSILADRAFSGRIVIPEPFRKYYGGIVSDRVLHCSKAQRYGNQCL